jgi:hypothetical protein
MGRPKGRVNMRKRTPRKLPEKVLLYSTDLSSKPVQFLRLRLAESCPKLLDLSIGLQSAIIANDHVKLITALIGADHNGDSTFAFSLSDVFASDAPAMISTLEGTKFFLTLVPSGAAATLGLTTIATDPMTLPGLLGGPQGFDRFTLPWYDPTEPTSTPVFAWLPVMPKLPFEHAIPDNLNLNGWDNHDASINTETYHGVWLQGAATVVTNNGGASFHNYSTLFDVTALDLTGSPDLAACATVVHLEQFVIPLLKSNSYFDSVQARIKDVFTSSLFDQGATPTSLVDPHPVLVSTMTRTEQNLETQIDKQILNWRGFLVCAKPSGDLYLPELNATFLAFLRCNKIHDAFTMLKRMLHDFQHCGLYRASLGPLYKDTTLRPAHLSIPFVQAIQKCNWITSSLNTEPREIRNGISSFSLATPNEASASFVEIVTGSQSLIQNINCGLPSTVVRSRMCPLRSTLAVRSATVTTTSPARPTLSPFGALHVAGSVNICADMWSRPDKPDYRLSADALLTHIDYVLSQFP